MKELRLKLLSVIRSLKLRIALCLFVLAVIPALVGTSVYSSNVERREISALTLNLTSQAQLISSQIISGGYMQNTSGSLSNRLNSLREVFVGRVMIMDNNMNILIDTYNIYEGKVMIWENAIRSINGETVSQYDNTNNILAVSIPIASAEDIEKGDIKGVVMISRNTDYISQNVEFFKNLGFLAVIIIAVVAFILSVIMAFVLVHPIDSFSKNVDGLLNESITEIKRSTTTEINHISNAITEYHERQMTMDNSLRDFISNVSHELKTPLTSMKIMADSLTSSEDTPVEFYKEFMEDIASEIDRETLLINYLLGLVKTEGQAAKLNIEECNINDILESVLRKLSPLAESRHIELVLETFRPIMMEVDEVKISQAMINLVENAIKYNKDEGFVHVSVNSDINYCYIRVEDSGIGIPKENLDQIFERFYRVDVSHSKEIEGTGLGLSIVKNIIILHGGQIKADSIKDEGSTFTIRLPLMQSK